MSPLFSRPLVAAIFLAAAISSAPGASHLATMEEAIAANRDLWGDAALESPSGPSYEFFEKLLPPPRYVNADFRYYPLVLSAPRSAVKARLISNGSAINARGGARSWNDPGIPLTFRVGTDDYRFGENFNRLSEPQYLDGYLPVVTISYHHGETLYRQESFASVDPEWSQFGLILVRFSVEGARGNLAVDPGELPGLKMSEFALNGTNGQQWAWFDSNWKTARGLWTALLNSNQTAVLAVSTLPIPAGKKPAVSKAFFDQEKKKAVTEWKNFLAGGMEVEVPEKRVNDAWRSHLIANLSLIHSNRIHYSSGNQYDKLYESEGSDAALAMLHWGQSNLVRELIPPLLDFTRKGLEFHQAGHKLQTLAYFYWLTRDLEFIRQMEPRWQKEVERVVNGRTRENGLFPREQYCGDIATPVFSLNSNAKCWRALRDFSLLVGATGDKASAAKLQETSARFRQDILKAVEKSERRDTTPPFIPIALFGEEEPYPTLTATKMGSYYDLMANYVIGSGIFGPNSEREKWMIEYLQQHGGLCFGLTRSRPNPTFWTGLSSINPLYGQRYVIALLQRDEPDRALVSFYGMLAQGMTRDTFVGGEGCSIRPFDDHGRLFYCPPNSASNGFFLWMLRFLLVQDWDLDDDGDPETLRLLHATPPRWLENGKTISVRKAPSAFGGISMHVDSQLEAGLVRARLELPSQAPRKTLLRLRLPSGWKISEASAAGEKFAVDPRGTIDLTGKSGALTIEAKVGRF